MSSKPFFSVIIPCYNRSSSMAPVLSAVKSQTFEDFECLIIDDGSSDAHQLVAVISSLEDNRFRYIRRSNGGASAARNTGIDAAQGSYIAFLDSDDIFLDHKLQSDYAAINQLDNPRTVIFSQVLIDRGVGKLWLRPPRPPKQGEKIAPYLICHGGFTQTSTLVVERKLAQAARFTEGLPMAQDFDFPIRLEALGARFFMKNKPSVIWNDVATTDRVSSSPAYEPMLDWIEQVRPLIGSRAYYAFRGSHIARLAAGSNRILAIQLLLQALIRFAMPFKLAVKSIVQVFLPRRLYRKLLDWLIKTVGVKIWN